MASKEEPKWLKKFSPKYRKFLHERLGHGKPMLERSDFSETQWAQPGFEKVYQILEDFQRQLLLGFTAKQLKQIGCWDKSDAKASDLGRSYPVHLMYHGERWSKTPGENIGHGYPGTYNYSNTVVRDVLRPTAVLASLFLDNIEMWTCELNLTV
jgi:hypothetical protein